MAKRVRKNGEKRAYLKRFSQAAISTGKSVNPVIAAEYHDRAKSLRLKDWEDHGSPFVKERVDANEVERTIALNKVNAILSQVRNDQKRTIFLINRKRPDGSPIVRVRLVKDEDNTVFLIHEDFRTREFKKSIPYPDRETATDRLNTRRVQWVSSFVVPSSQTAD